MTLRRLTAENVRCLSEVRLEPAGSNLIFGENASGKTSLLEAIFVLGRARSFRLSGRNGLIRDEQAEATVVPKLIEGGDVLTPEQVIEDIEACLEKGSDPEQMTEAVHVAVAIRGGASLVHGVQMLGHAHKTGM